jgi:hypothetical protein
VAKNGDGIYSLKAEQIRKNGAPSSLLGILTVPDKLGTETDKLLHERLKKDHKKEDQYKK